MIECSSDPNSELNCARRELMYARIYLSAMNRDGGNKSHGMRRLNLQRNRLREVAHKMRGTHRKAERHDPHHETTIDGIPCGIVVESYTPGRPWRQHTFPGAGPGDCDPPEPADCEWFVVDRRGYRADWLLDKLTPKKVREIEQEMGI